MNHEQQKLHDKQRKKEWIADQPTRNPKKDFKGKVIEAIRRRAGGICVLCSQYTSGPGDGVNEAYDFGEAAHINGAAKSGPRYDDFLSEEYVSSTENGIWLCRNCHDKIDASSSVKSYPVDYLKQLRTEHEERLKERWNDLSEDHKLAREIISRYEQTAVLFNAEDLENPKHAVKSLLKMKDLIIDWQSRDITNVFRRHLKSMSKMLLEFCHNKENDGEMPGQNFFSNLLEFRKLYGLKIKFIIDNYSIVVDEESALNIIL